MSSSPFHLLVVSLPLLLSLVTSFGHGQYINNRICISVCFCDTTAVDCNRNDRLQGIPGTLPPGYTKLRIQNAKFESRILQRRNLTNLQQLVSLKMVYCGLEQIDDYAFYDLTNLRYLDLSNNKLKTIVDYTFYNLKLTELHLQDNSGVVIGRNSFQGLSTKELNLRNNQIKTLDYETYAGMGIVKLFLHNNSISIVDSRFKKIFDTKPKVLDLSLNPIHCTCKLAWLRRLMTADSEGYKNIRMVCASPSEYANKNLETLHPRVFVCPSPQIQSISIDIWPTWAQLVCTASGYTSPGLTWTYQEGMTEKTTSHDPKKHPVPIAMDTGLLINTSLSLNVSVTPNRRSYNCTTWGVETTDDSKPSIVVHIRGPPITPAPPPDLVVVPTRPANLGRANSDTSATSKEEGGQEFNSAVKQHFIYRKQFTLMEMIGAVVGTFIITLALLLIISRVIKLVKRHREKKKTYWSTPGSAYSATGSHEYDVPRLDHAATTATYNHRAPAYHSYNPDGMNFLDFKTQQKIYT